MKTIICKKCNDYCSVKKSNKRNGDILEMGEMITHCDGTKEHRVYAIVNEKTNTILDSDLIGGTK